MKDRRPLLISLLVGALTLAACSTPRTATDHPPSLVPRSPSPEQPTIGELVGVRGEPIAIASLEGRIAFSAGTDDVYVVDADGSGLRRVTVSPHWDFDPSWSPDGRQLVYRHQTGDDATTEIFRIDADGTNVRNLTRNEGVADWGPTWSPDGATVAWNSDLGSGVGSLHGYLMDPDGRDVRRIRGETYVEYPTWSPDGTRIAFMSSEGNDSYDIFVMNADGSGQVQLTDSEGPDGWPAWSPDGSQIAFSSVRDDCIYSDADGCLRTGDIGPYHTLYVMDADGSHQRRVTRTFAQFAAWSPDGRYILFAPWLNVIRPDGTGLARIPVSGTTGEPEMPDWTSTEG